MGSGDDDVECSRSIDTSIPEVVFLHHLVAISALYDIMRRTETKKQFFDHLDKHVNEHQAHGVLQNTTLSQRVVLGR